MIFIDEGAMTPDSFAVHYNQMGPWWDDPPVRHGDGTTVSWADGHVSHLKWKAAETIKRARATANYYYDSAIRILCISPLPFFFGWHRTLRYALDNIGIAFSVGSMNRGAFAIVSTPRYWPHRRPARK
jgi:prepilin-type processing-associated H-X9-DG protein